MNLNIYESCQHNNCHHSHVDHALVCHANCNHEEHIEKGYSNTIINFFSVEEVFEQDDSVKTYLSLMRDLPDSPSI